MFATKQVDPGAPTYSLEFLRKHPEISTRERPLAHAHGFAASNPGEEAAEAGRGQTPAHNK